MENLRYLLALSVMMIAPLLSAQPTQVAVVPTTTTPTGNCSTPSMNYVTPAGTIYTCQNGIWAQASGGGGGSGTVTQVNTSGPITGGPITATGTIDCPTCVATTTPPLIVSGTLTLYYAPASITTCLYNGDAGTACTPSDATAFLSNTKATPFVTLARCWAAVSANGPPVMTNNAQIKCQAADTALTTITNNPLAAGGTNVTTAANFPCSTNDIAEIEQEYVKVTAGCGTSSLTVTRTQNGTTNSAHVLGAGISLLKTGFVYTDSDVQFTGVTPGTTPYSFTESGQDPNYTNVYPSSYFDFAGNDAHQWNVVFTGAGAGNESLGTPINGALIRCLAVNCRFHGFAENMYGYINTGASNFNAFVGPTTVAGGGASGFWDHISGASNGGQGVQIARVMQGAQGFKGPGLIAYNMGISFAEGQASKMFSYHPAGYMTYTLVADGLVASGTGTSDILAEVTNETGQQIDWGPTSKNITCVNGASGTPFGTQMLALAFSKMDNAQNASFGGASTVTYTGCSGKFNRLSSAQSSQIFDSAGSTGNTITCDAGSCTSGTHFFRDINVNSDGRIQAFESMGATAVNVNVSGSYKIAPFGTMTGVDAGADRVFAGTTTPCATTNAPAIASGIGCASYNSSLATFELFQGSATGVLPATVAAAGLTTGLVGGVGTNGQAQNVNLSGDCTTSVLVITCTKINGGAFPTTASGIKAVAGQPVAQTATDVVTQFSGCSGVQYLGADGACHNASGTSGGGSSGWSGITLSLLANATQFTPYVGGAITSTTETVVSLPAQAAATISGLTVTLSASLGAATTLAVTFEDGTATPTALTCATTSAGTTCSDFTHSVNVAQGDLLSFKIVATGTVTAATPQLVIGYAVGTSNVGITGSGANTQLSAWTGTNSQGAVTQWTTNGTTTVFGSATSILDLRTTQGGQIKYGPIAPWFSDTDGICAAAAGTPACPAGSIIASGANEASFATNVTVPANTPAINRVLHVLWGYNAGGQAGVPNLTTTLRACPTANLTLGNATTCSSGGVALWTSIAGANTNFNGNTNGQYWADIQGDGAGDLYVNVGQFNRQGTGTGVNNPTKVTFSTSAAWTLYWTVKFSANTAGNWVLQAQGVPSYVQ